ncbi:MAG: SDR family NAD(P)-dependent oxidoreductase [Deltaproteobacteria bacterium]|nr:SDR family NAD(P)-dependent oxidoreductase [Deltaproteobacteria bacterium]
MNERVVVTGGNRGLGLGVVDRLGQRGYRVVLASRDALDGEREASRARARGRDVIAIPLEVTSAEALRSFSTTLGEGPLGAVVSNAGVALDGFDESVVEQTLAVNYYGATGVVRALEDRLVPGSRVVMVSSAMGALDGFDKRVRSRFERPKDYAAVEAALAEFRDLVHRGRETAEGWPRSAYRISKIALNAWTRLYAEEMRSRDVHVNAVCPGWVRTRMGGAGASRSVREGAEGIVWAAMLPKGGPTGGFFRDGKPVPW